VFEADGSVLAQKIGMDSYPVEVVRLRPGGREQKLFSFTPSVMASNRTSVVKGRELQPFAASLRCPFLGLYFRST
jgi:hypothetical protein